MGLGYIIHGFTHGVPNLDNPPRDDLQLRRLQVIVHNGVTKQNV